MHVTVEEEEQEELEKQLFSSEVTYRHVTGHSVRSKIVVSNSSRFMDIYRVITNNVNDYINLLVRIAHIICNHLYILVSFCFVFWKLLRCKDSCNVSSRNETEIFTQVTERFSSIQYGRRRCPSTAP